MFIPTSIHELIVDYISDGSVYEDYQRHSLESYIAVLRLLSTRTHFEYYMVISDLGKSPKKQTLMLKSHFRLRSPSIGDFDCIRRINYVIGDSDDVHNTIETYTKLSTCLIGYSHTLFENLDIYDSPKNPVINLQPSQLSFKALDLCNFLRIRIHNLPQCAKIEDGFFHGKDFTEIDLSGLFNVKTIGRSFLRRCRYLTELDMQPLRRLEIIENYFLTGASSLKKIDMSNMRKLKSIGDFYLSSTKELYIADLTHLISLTEVGWYFMRGSGIKQFIARFGKPSGIRLAKGYFLDHCCQLKTFMAINPEAVSDSDLEFEIQSCPRHVAKLMDRRTRSKVITKYEYTG